MLDRTRLSIPAIGLAVGTVLAVAGCQTTDAVSGVDGGRVQFVLSSGASAPVMATDETAPLPQATDGERDGYHRFFESANVTFSSILARNLDGVLVDVEGMDLPTTVDIVSLEGGREVTLDDGVLPPATYDQVVVVMTEVEGVTFNGTTITITPPGGGWTAIIPICPFVVEDGETTTVGLKFMLDHAFSWRDMRYHFHPRFTCEEG